MALGSATREIGSIMQQHLLQFTPPPFSINKMTMAMTMMTMMTMMTKAMMMAMMMARMMIWKE